MNPSEACIGYPGNETGRAVIWRDFSLGILNAFTVIGGRGLMVKVTDLVLPDSIEHIVNQTGYLEVLILACAIPYIYLKRTLAS